MRLRQILVDGQRLAAGCLGLWNGLFSGKKAKEPLTPTCRRDTRVGQRIVGLDVDRPFEELDRPFQPWAVYL